MAMHSMHKLVGAARTKRGLKEQQETQIFCIPLV
jgi:hypothetical protein